MVAVITFFVRGGHPCQMRCLMTGALGLPTVLEHVSPPTPFPTALPIASQIPWVLCHFLVLEQSHVKQFLSKFNSTGFFSFF